MFVCEICDLVYVNMRIVVFGVLIEICFSGRLKVSIYDEVFFLVIFFGNLEFVNLD